MPDGTFPKSTAFLSRPSERAPRKHLEREEGEGSKSNLHIDWMKLLPIGARADS